VISVHGVRKDQLAVVVAREVPLLAHYSDKAATKFCKSQMADLQPAMNWEQDPAIENNAAQQPQNSAVAQGGALPGAPAVAAAMGNVPPIFQALTRHNTFALLFADATADLNHANAFRVVDSFDPNNEAPLTAAALKQAVIGQQAPHTFLCCTSLNGNVPKIYLVHSLSRYPMSLTGQPTPWDNRIIGFLGDVVGKSALNAILPEEIFDTTAETFVYNTATLNQALVDLDDAALLPRVRKNANNAVTQQSRYLAYLPTRFTSLVIDNKGYTVRQMCGILMQQCQDKGCLDLMSPLMNWLRLSLHATGQNKSGPR